MVNFPAPYFMDLEDNYVTILGNAQTFNATGATTTTPIDGIPCTGPLTTLGQHFHDHISLYVNGQRFAIPAAIGIYHPKKYYGQATALDGWFNRDTADSSSCHYLIHTHTGEGTMHIETASTTQQFFLNEFLDIWGVAKSTTGFWTFSGPTRWFETKENPSNPGHYQVQEITNVDPSTIQLTAHVEFTVEVGTPVVNIFNYSWIETDL